jgi:hypothetical protein
MNRASSIDQTVDTDALRTAEFSLARVMENPIAVVFVALVSLGVMRDSRADDAVAHAIGTAYDLDGEMHLYSETHCVSGDALEREVIYRDAEEQLIAHKTLDYQTGPTTPSYVQRNFHAGESIIVELRKDTIDMTVRDMTVSDGAGAGETVSAPLDTSKPLVIDAGFDAFVTGNWDALVAGQSMRFQFPFAARESLFALRINAARCSYGTGADQCFRLELDNWILRALLDPIELGYDASLKRLVRYRGLSNIGDGKGAGQVVDIRYRYHDLPALACEMDETLGEETVLGLDVPSPVFRL